MSATLSVIIPTYNRAEYVRNCLMALKTSGIEELEVIVSDDGSTDDTEKVVSATYPEAIYLWQPNSGTPATARNTAFARSTGRYVSFLDCDDTWLPEAPARAVGFLDRHPNIDVLFADARVGNSTSGYESWIQVAGQDSFWQLPAAVPEAGLRVLERSPFFRRMTVRNAVFIGSCIMRREAFERVGTFDPTLCGAADWELWLRMAHQLTFAFMTEPLAIYTRHPDNMSGNQDGMVREFCLALRGVLKKCKLNVADARLVQEQLRHHLFQHAYIAYDTGRYGEARSRFREVLLAGERNIKVLAYWLACQLPDVWVSRLRRVKQVAS